MNCRRSRACIFIAAMATVVWIAPSAKSQTSNEEPFAEASSGIIHVEGGDFRVNAPTKIRASAGAEMSGRAMGMMGWGIVADSIRKAAEAVRDAKNDEEKKLAENALDEQLSKYFDEDLVRREEELAKIEERLTKLRELLERRRAKKQEIVDLQAKVALNEADGLGFYNTERQGKGGAFGAAFSTSSPIFVQPPQVPPLPAKVAVPGTAPTPPTPPAKR